MSGFLAQVVPAALKRPIHRVRLFARARLRDLADLRARVQPAPVIVLGHQKCGTSAIAALLGAISGRSVAIDLQREVERPTFQRLHGGELDLDRFIRANRLEFSREIVKEANLTPLHAELRRRFPESRFAFVIRDPRSNLRSILQRLSLPGRPGDADPAALARVSESWRLVLDGTWLGLEGDDYLAMLAARWQHFADIAAGARDELEILRYEDFLADKAGAIRDLAARLGLPHDRDISAGLDVQYQPRGDHSASLLDFFGAEGLARIERICARGMADFGYEAAPAS